MRIQCRKRIDIETIRRMPADRVCPQMKRQMAHEMVDQLLDNNLIYFRTEVVPEGIDVECEMYVLDKGEPSFQIPDRIEEMATNYLKFGPPSFRTGGLVDNPLITSLKNTT